MGYVVTDLLRVMERLRDPERGCPWDLQQDFHSIVPSTLEECYELAQAIEHSDYPHVAEELGDVLFQVVFYAQLGREQNLFSFEGIVHTLVEKLIRRHPHVFAAGNIEGMVPDSERGSLGSVRETWEAIKEEERKSKEKFGALDDVPVALPALPRAQKLQKRAARVGFDWDRADGVLEKLEEEMVELRRAMQVGNDCDVEEEMGDVLFTCVNLARHLGLDSESSLRRSANKFEQRFRRMEVIAETRGDPMVTLTPEQLEVLWEQAKEGVL